MSEKVWEVLTTLFFQAGILVILALLLSKLKLFCRLVTANRITVSEKLAMAALFGAVGILGTYIGIPVQGAIANSRVVGVFVGGLLCGPLVGALSGLIAGIHRFAIDVHGFASVSCMTATIMEGITAGLLSRAFHRSAKKWLFALSAGAIAETVHMGLVLAMARPFSAAVDLVSVILIPMILVNAAGLGMIIAIMEGIFREQERIAADQARTVLDIVNKTIQFFRKGFNCENARKTAKIIHVMTDFAAVDFTDTVKILAHVGEGEDHHFPGSPLRTSLTRETLESGQYRIATDKSDIGCEVDSCRLRSAIIAPLREKDRVIGTLKLYKTEANAVSSAEVELALGLASLFSTQIELSRIEYQEKMLASAELKVLQAQINPHFLFNAINTIHSLVRTDPDRARELLGNFSLFFRKNIRQNHASIPLDKEIEHVTAYLSIEKARFGDKLQVDMDIPKSVKPMVPPLILQPIVENAVKHGVRPMTRGGTISISARRVDGNIRITVHDDGRGIESRRLAEVLCAKGNGDSIGLFNVNERLVSLYGAAHALDIKSSRAEGTTVTLLIPDGRAGHG